MAVGHHPTLSNKSASGRPECFVLAWTSNLDDLVAFIEGFRLRSLQQVREVIQPTCRLGRLDRIKSNIRQRSRLNNGQN